MTTQDQLTTLLNKWVLYQGEKIFINSATINKAGLIMFKTNKQQFVLPEEDFLIEDFEIMESTVVTQKEDNKYLGTPTQQSAQGGQIFNNTNSIIQTLMESIADVKNGNNIDQAQTINDLSKTIIEAVKTQVLAVKVMQGVK